jgi:hypothetical protein
MVGCEMWVWKIWTVAAVLAATATASAHVRQGAIDAPVVSL